MIRNIFILIILFLSANSSLTAQVRIRLFSGKQTESVIFTVVTGKYQIRTPEGSFLTINPDVPVIISRYNGMLAIKPVSFTGMMSDSVSFKPVTSDASFSLRINSSQPFKQSYTGDLSCHSDMGTLFLVNTCDIEQYIAGVVRAEGGAGQKKEYFKTQAVLVRTYMYKYFDKHISDGYNLCDNTHCQVFNGVSTDSEIISAAKETHNIIISDRDSNLIISAFHSNCGGETSPAEDVWLSNQPYLKKVNDPYCLSSRNAKWQKSITIKEWTDYLVRSGLNPNDKISYNFIQETRVKDYKAGSLTLPTRIIRSDLDLRSAFFSVTTNGDSVILNGRGFGHGVGLCQEGAMVMAEKGFNYQQIIDFYYSDVLITDIKNLKVPDK